MKLNEKIKLIRTTEGFTQVEFAKLIGVSHEVSVRRIESGKQEPGASKIESICNQFPKYTTWLMTDNVPMPDKNIISIQFMDLKVSGSGIEPIGEGVIKSIQVDVHELKKKYNITASKTIHVLGVRGDSMAPTFQDKDLILLDASDTNFQDGVWVFEQDDHIYVKRLQQTPKQILAISDNNRYEKFSLSKNSRLIAKVLGAWCWSAT